MKKNYILLSFLTLSLTFLKGQTSLLVTNSTNGGSVVTNSMTVYASTSAGNTTHVDFDFKNTSSSSKTYLVTRFKDVRNVVGPGDSAMIYFCTGSNCYTPNTATSMTVPLTPGSSIALKTYLDEATVAGQSSYRYKIYNVSDVNDFVIFTLAYNNPLSVKSNESLFANVSGVFPNPVLNKAKINITSNSDRNDILITVTNSLGSVVLSKNTDVVNGKNSITLDTESLSAGIYFATVYDGESTTIRKFIINK